jgi:hypothetical protein
VLVSRKTNSAVAQLERIARARPESEGLARMWVEARAALRDDRWRGTEPRELMRLAERSELRLIESGFDLLNRVRTSLARFQDDLRGELRAVVGLWNESPRGNTPKGEEHLANAIARHLRQDLRDRQIVIGRELILQVGVLGGAKGQRTDIDVRAWSSQHPPNDGEVASRHRGERFMEFICLDGHEGPSWRSDANRARSARLGSVEALSARLSAQAADLSNAMRLVQSLVLDTSLPAGSSAKANRR